MVSGCIAPSRTMGAATTRLAYCLSDGALMVDVSAERRGRDPAVGGTRRMIRQVRGSRGPEERILGATRRRRRRKGRRSAVEDRLGTGGISKYLDRRFSQNRLVRIAIINRDSNQGGISKYLDRSFRKASWFRSRLIIAIRIRGSVNC
jgi:hypothetical protein